LGEIGNGPFPENKNGIDPAKSEKECLMERLAGGKSETNVLRYLQGIRFPAKKDDIVHAARKSGAPNDVIGALSQLPVNEFANERELLDAYPHLE
jgi:hypothetical protein